MRRGGRPGGPSSRPLSGSGRSSRAALPATVETVYDLASLTKAVVTSLLVMKGVEKGRLHLDEPLGDHLRCWRTGRR